MTRTMFIENVKLSDTLTAVLLAEACGISKSIIDLWLLTIDD